MTSEEETNNIDDGQAAPGETILNHPLNTEMKNSYINYAMSVIIGRALPDARDGLKPVHRRVLTVCLRADIHPKRNSVNRHVRSEK